MSAKICVNIGPVTGCPGSNVAKDRHSYDNSKKIPYKDDYVFTTINYPGEFKKTAITIDTKLKLQYGNINRYYLWENGMEQVAIPKMVKLIDFMKENPIPNRQKLLDNFL